MCEKVCDAGAINFADTEKMHTLSVGALVLAPGFEPFNPEAAGIWGYGKFPNVITSLQLERYLSATGPTEGHLARPSDGKPVRKMAFLQCVGSRDENKCGKGYCSSVCCMAAIKEASMAKDHIPGLSTSIFYMDMRTHGKGFDKYYEQARDEFGVRFVRCRVHGVEPHGKNGDLRLRYINEQGRQVEEYYDMVVLSVGMETPKHALDMADLVGIQMTANNFAAASDFSPVTTSKEGIFTCGAFAGPKDIPQSVVEGSAAAAAVAQFAGAGPGKIDPGEGLSGGEGCDHGDSSDRYLCLPLRFQYRRCRRCGGRRKICRDACRCRPCRAEYVCLFRGCPADPDKQDQGKGVEPHRYCRLHSPNP